MVPTLEHLLPSEPADRPPVLRVRASGAEGGRVPARRTAESPWWRRADSATSSSTRSSTRPCSAIEARDGSTLESLPEEKLQSGSSEIKNWIVAAGAMEHLAFEEVDYVPGYRSPAGTGCGMAFGRWR